MFIMSFKMTKLKLLLVAAAVVVIAAAIIFASQDGDVLAMGNDNVSFKNIKTNEQRIAFLKAFGWEVEEEPVEVVEVVIPEEFTPVYEKYNEVQKAQGLDLSKYRGKRVKRWTYLVKNYPTASKGQVHANIILYKDRVIAGDICSTELDGFIHGLARPDSVQTSATAETEATSATVDNFGDEDIGEAVYVDSQNVLDWEDMDVDNATYEG